MSQPLTLWRNARVATCDAAMQAFESGAVLTRGDLIEWVGAEQAMPEALRSSVGDTHDLDGRWITPALIDCHTHLIYAGNRAAEFAERLRGVSYEEISRRGGGIASTMRATRAASEKQLFDEMGPMFPGVELRNDVFMNKRITGAPAAFAYTYYPWAAHLGAAE